MRSAAPALLALLAGLLLASCGGPTGTADTGAGSLPFDGRSPLVPQARKVRVLVELRRPSLATQMAQLPFSAGRQRAYVSNLGDEATALQSALRAKDVRLGKPLLFARVWNGFAATVDTRDLPKLRALGLRAEPVRRFYGAAAGGGAVGTGGGGAAGGGAAAGAGTADDAADAERGAPAVALLDSGVDRGAAGLRGRVVPGFDAVGGDRDPAPAGSREGHGTHLAQVLASALGPAGGQILSIRVAGLQPDARTGGRVELGTTDQLLAGLERAVDPDGDGDTTDHVPVALVGVNSPYAGFAESPEAVAGGGARALGTLVVAPAGNEGRGGGMLGTVGSPAAAPGVLGVGGLEGGGAPALPSIELGLATGEGRASLRGALLGGGDGRALRAPVAALAGPSQADPRAEGRALGGTPLEYFGVNASPRARGRVVVVPARGSSATTTPALTTRAAAAADAGAAALVVCEPDAGEPLPAIPGGVSSIPVVGLRGEAAARALELTPEDGGLAFLSEPDSRTDDARIASAINSSDGPTYALAPKPDLTAPGTATLPGGGTATGTSIAAAKAAAAAALLHEAKPAARPDDLIAALAGTAGAMGEVRLAAAKAAPALIEPATLALARQKDRTAFSIARELTVRNPGTTTQSLKLTVQLAGTKATLTPSALTLDPGAKETVTLDVAAEGSGLPAGYRTGRLTATADGNVRTSTVIGLPVGPPPPARLGELTLTGKNGVRFTAGAVTVKNGLRAVEPLGNLTLQLVDAKGDVARALTPPGGASDLLPGEYAYTLTRDVKQGLAPGAYTFLARGRGPAGGAQVTRKSPSFTVR